MSGERIKQTLAHRYAVSEAAKAGLRPPPKPDGIDRYPETGMAKDPHVREGETLKKLDAFLRLADKDPELIADRALVARLSRWQAEEDRRARATLEANWPPTKPLLPADATPEQALEKLEAGELAQADYEKFKQGIERVLRGREIDAVIATAKSEKEAL
jgi:multidrug efflux pump subunit AcrA (membrane-fusion protein)